jgi:galactokinase
MEQLRTAKTKLVKEFGSDVAFRRARHVITENKRTVDMAEALKKGDWKTCGKLMFASHDSLRDDFEVSCKELDLLVDIAREIGSDGGMIGSRMTGGGFGGCTVSLVKTDKIDSISQIIRKKYKSRTRPEPTIFATQPAEGARMVRK